MRNFAKVLTGWYQENARDLPWRRTKDPYKIWVSEIMLQQTTVNAVIPYFEKWVNVFPTVQDLASAELETVLRHWQGLGYYNRARNLHKAAQHVVSLHKGLVPKSPDLARKLPGFGPYTVGAVLSIAYDQKIPIIDANVRRVVMRLLSLEGIADTKKDKKVLEFLYQVLPDRNIGDFNQGLMELGATVCRSREPLCIQCKVRRFCLAYKLGKQEIIPEPKKKMITDIRAVIGIIENNGRYFIQRRPPKGLLADLWEFPGGKLEEGESAKGALIREMKEELDIAPKSCKYLFDVQHFYTQFRVNLSVWQFHPRAFPVIDEIHKWVLPSEFAMFPMPSGSARIVDRLFSKKNI
jgi:A/G-specific adenine glycosylase